MAKFSPSVPPVDAGAVASYPALDAIAARAAAQLGHENFPVALRVLPRGPRAELTALYAYARFVDDVGDEGAVPPEQRLRRLDVIDDDVQRLADGTARLAPVAALGPLVAAHGVPLTPFRELVEANRVDQRTAAYATFDDLLGYCRLSAAPVGRIVLHLAEAATPANVADSDAVCAALQVLEHCQDAGEDARAGRVYLPGGELADVGLSRAELLGGSTPTALRPVVAMQVERARGLLAAGRPLVRRLTGWSRLAVAGFVAGGLATADALDAADHDVLPATIRPGRLRTAAVMASLLVPRAGGRP